MADYGDLLEAGRPTFYNCRSTQSRPHPPGVAMVTGGGQSPSAGGHKGEEGSYTTLPRIKWLTCHLWTGKKQSTASNENESKTLCIHFFMFSSSYQITLAAVSPLFSLQDYRIAIKILYYFKTGLGDAYISIFIVAKKVINYLILN